MDKFLEFMNYEVFGLEMYKYILAILIFMVFLGAKRLFSQSMFKMAKIVVSKSKTDIDDKILESIKPLDFLFIVFGIHIAFMILSLNSYIAPLTKGIMIFALFWFLYNLVVSFEKNILRMFNKKVSREIGTLLIKSLKIFAVALGFAAFLQNFGINVSAFIASLGLGGLAFALAAKDTVANLFGGFAILTDNIFKIGDWIRVGEVEGVVQDIGMRTTKILAFDKRMIVVPNANIANSAVDNYSRRDRRRIKMRIGLTYSTTSMQMKNILAQSRQMLLAHPDVHSDGLLVYFDEFSESNLSLFFYMFAKTSDWEEYLKIKEDVNLKIIDIIQTNKAEFAFPTQSVYFENELKLNK